MKGSLINKIKGVLFGGAIGDALGLGTEFIKKKMYRNTIPMGYMIIPK